MYNLFNHKHIWKRSYASQQVYKAVQETFCKFTGENVMIPTSGKMQAVLILKIFALLNNYAQKDGGPLKCTNCQRQLTLPFDQEVPVF
jgi:hypothetical protein